MLVNKQYICGLSLQYIILFQFLICNIQNFDCIDNFSILFMYV